MTLTNKYNLPAALVTAIEKHEHKGGDYSMSMLGNSSRQIWLRKRHEHEAVEDASDKIWALLGTAFHAIVQAGAGAHEIVEQYLEETILGRTVSGTADNYDGTELAVADWKTTSVWTIIYKSREKEWEAQLNGYAWLYRMAGFVVNDLFIIAILRDWSASKAAGDPNYPQCQVIKIRIPLWTQEQQLAYIEDRVALHEQFRNVPDAELPHCTAEERWDRGKGPQRCAQYCLGFQWCNQRQDELKAAAANPPAPIPETAAKTKRTKKEKTA